MKTTFSVDDKIAKLLRITASLKSITIQDAVEKALIQWVNKNMPENLSKKDLINLEENSIKE